ncbi:MAG: glycosyltransferase family 2 protein [Candidatus Bathyarchaeota archaeon]|nr:glycosyltransferase family 2 protein [Candidatus Bathyarchaeota archaeon]
MANNNVLISVVIPVFNEAPTIGNIIERLNCVMQETGLQYELIVVDDCSTDNSVEIAKRYGVKLFILKKHAGKGFALRLGFTKARGSIIAMIDSDGSHYPEDLPKLLEPALQNKADLVIGSRYFGGSLSSAKKLNFAGVRIFNFLIKLLIGIRVSDSQSGYRVLKSLVLSNISLKSREYEIESEMLVKIAKRGFRIMEVPISFEPRTYGASNLDPIVDGFKILLSIVSSCIKDGRV